jgi:hypothetical protein
MSKLYVDEIASKTSGNKIMMPQGGIIQVQYTQVIATSTHTSASALSTTTVTPLNVNITPLSSSSIIMLTAGVTGEWSRDGASWDSTWFFLRDSTKLSSPPDGTRNVGIHMGTNITIYAADNNSTPDNAQYTYFDTPSTTSTINYKVAFSDNGTGTWHLNKTVSDTNVAGHERGISFIMAQEIAG